MTEVKTALRVPLGEKKVTISREQFIGRMVQHILPKGLKPLRYYGLQATCIQEKVRQKINQALKVVVQLGMELLGQPITNLSYQEKIKRSYGYDPFTCSHCGGQMYLWQLWVKGTGFTALRVPLGDRFAQNFSL